MDTSCFTLSSLQRSFRSIRDVIVHCSSIQPNNKTEAFRAFVGESSQIKEEWREPFPRRNTVRYLSIYQKWLIICDGWDLLRGARRDTGTAVRWDQSWRELVVRLQPRLLACCCSTVPWPNDISTRSSDSHRICDVRLYYVLYWTMNLVLEV